MILDRVARLHAVLNRGTLLINGRILGARPDGVSYNILVLILGGVRICGEVTVQLVTICTRHRVSVDCHGCDLGILDTVGLAGQDALTSESARNSIPVLHGLAGQHLDLIRCLNKDDCVISDGAAVELVGRALISAHVIQIGIVASLVLFNDGSAADLTVVVSGTVTNHRANVILCVSIGQLFQLIVAVRVNGVGEHLICKVILRNTNTALGSTLVPLEGK